MPLYDLNTIYATGQEDHLVSFYSLIITCQGHISYVGVLKWMHSILFFHFDNFIFFDNFDTFDNCLTMSRVLTNLENLTVFLQIIFF